MMEKIDLNLLRIFIEVYNLKSITLAAESLGLTQPGVSGAIKRLQQYLGKDLFVREGRGISPTYTAIQLAESVNPALQQIEMGLSNVHSFDIQSKRTFHVLVNEPMMQLLQPLVEADTSLGNCEICFGLTPPQEDDLFSILSLQKADLAIDVGIYPTSGYHQQACYSDHIVAICRKGHPRIDKQLTQEQYYAEKHITLKIRRSELYAADYFTEDTISQRQISCECESLLSMMTMVSESNCLGVAAGSLAEKYAEKLGLNILALPFTVKPISQKMVWHNRHNKSQAHIWVRNKLLDYLSQIENEQ
ncbi:LysR family transcriptional regulator [Photobacterium leiognathi]|uniref:LysR family transcriptional regulator n=1 Tax=Photobacterium leiognathi TaxID=553611 RepID=UPI0029813553|nr:LysR family transcriptional regulator [Photobacterium leiognathi]